MIGPIVLAVVQLAQSIVSLIPDPSPEVQAIKARHRAEKLAQHYAHQDEVEKAKRGRK